MQGLFLFNKPSGPSSAQFLNQVKHTLKLSRGVRIGHGGTLDPFADGLLVVGISRAYTKLLHQQLLYKDKEYEAEIILGATSDTDDKTGKIEKTKNVENIVRQFTRISEQNKWIQTAIEKLKKQEHQTPPNYSAIKIQGVPAYTRSRKGENLSLAPKKVSLLRYHIQNIKEKDSCIVAKIILLVSSGFYIRSFARDLGAELGVGGYVNALKRTKIGTFSLKNALNLDDLDKTVEFHLTAINSAQNVDFGIFVRQTARDLAITGFYKNIENNLIEIVGQGSLYNLQSFLEKIKHKSDQMIVKNTEDWFEKPTKSLKTFLNQTA